MKNIKIDLPKKLANRIFEAKISDKIYLLFEEFDLALTIQSSKALKSSIQNIMLIIFAIILNYMKVDERFSLLFVSIFYITILLKAIRSMYLTILNIQFIFGNYRYYIKKFFSVYFQNIRLTWNHRSASIGGINIIVKELEKEYLENKKMIILEKLRGKVRYTEGNISIQLYDKSMEIFRLRIAKKFKILIFNITFYTSIFFLLRSLVFQNVYGKSPLSLIFEPLKIIISMFT